LEAEGAVPNGTGPSPKENGRCFPHRPLPLLGSSRQAEPQEKAHRSCGGHCPSWARTRTLLIQSQACCQLHQGAVLLSIVMELRGIEPLTSAVRLQRSPS